MDVNANLVPPVGFEPTTNHHPLKMAAKPIRVQGLVWYLPSESNRDVSLDSKSSRYTNSRRKAEKKVTDSQDSVEGQHSSNRHNPVS